MSAFRRMTPKYFPANVTYACSVAKSENCMWICVKNGASGGVRRASGAWPWCVCVLFGGGGADLPQRRSGEHDGRRQVDGRVRLPRAGVRGVQPVEAQVERQVEQRELRVGQPRAVPARRVRGGCVACCR